MRKLLLLGIIILVISVPFFYLAATVPYQDVTENHDEVNPVQDGAIGRDSWLGYPFEDMPFLPVKPYKFVMHPGESLLFTCSAPDFSRPYVILEDEATLSILNYANSSKLDYRNNGSSTIFIGFYVATNIEGTYSTEILLNHHEIPNWILLGFAIILVALEAAIMATMLLLKPQTYKHVI